MICQSRPKCPTRPICPIFRSSRPCPVGRSPRRVPWDTLERLLERRGGREVVAFEHNSQPFYLARYHQRAA